MNWLKTLTRSLLFVVITLFSLHSVAQGNYLNWAGAWQYGTSESVEVDTIRQVAFLSSGGAVIILDMNDPENPVFVNQEIRTRGRVLDIQYDYNTENLLLAANEAGLEIWDVSDLTNPHFLGKSEIIYGGVETPVEQVKIYQDFAIVECNWGYVHSVNISDPSNPYQVSFNGTMGNPAHDIYVSDDGYVHSTGQYQYVRLKINANGNLTSAGELYLAASTVFGNTSDIVYLNTGQLYIVNLTNGQSSYTNVNFHDILVRDGYAYMIGNTSFIIYDVHDIQNPEFISSVPISSYTDELVISGHYAFIANGYDGLRVVDFSDMDNPVEIGHYEGTGITWKSDISGDYAYLANSSSGLSIIDISNPNLSGPTKVGGIASESETRDVAISGNTAIIADWSSGVRLIDVADPTNPQEISRIEGINAWRVEVSGNILYVDAAVPNESDELQIYDISELSNPQLLSSKVLGNLIWEFEYHDGHLYISGNDDGLVIIDVGDPYNPFETSVVDLPSVLDVDIQNNIAYVASADWDGGLVRVDISDPATPTITNIYNPSGWFHPFKVAVQGDFVYTGENFGDVKLIDISNPSNPLELDEYVTSGDISQLFALNDWLFISDAQDGLQLLKNDLITGIPDNSISYDYGVQFYPNPVKEQGYFEIDLKQVDEIRLDIFNALGQKLETIGPINLNEGSQQININVGNYNMNRPGYLFYHIIGANINEGGKILVSE